MKIEQIYSGCLAQGAYYIESNGEVAIIDPLREVEPYLKRTKSANAKIKYIFETHFHADFISGHVTLSDTKQPLLLVTPEGQEEEAITRLSRVGFDGTIGYLKGGFKAWKQAGQEIDTISSVSADTIKEQVTNKKVPVFDVRKESEYTSEHMVDAQNTPLDFLNDHLTDFPKQKDFYLHCAGGYRSIIAASILKSRGIHNLINVEGGFGALKASGAEVSN